MADERTRLIRRHRGQRDARLVLVATEGSRTEKQYIDILKLKGLVDSARVSVEVIETPLREQTSAPAHVLARLKALAARIRVLDQDECWLVVDVDRWNSRGGLSQVASEAVQAGYRLAISNPCFEVWISLHFVDVVPVASECQTVKEFLRSTLGSYNEANLHEALFTRENVERAVRRATTADTAPASRWPPDASVTHVHRLIQGILKPSSDG